MTYTFEELPLAVSKLHDKLESIEKLLLEGPLHVREVDDLINIQQASVLINLTIATIYTKVSRKEIPYCKKGKRLYFSRQELTDWIRSGRHQTHQELIDATQDKLANIKCRSQ